MFKLPHNSTFMLFDTFMLCTAAGLGVKLTSKQQLIVGVQISFLLYLHSPIRLHDVMLD